MKLNIRFLETCMNAFQQRKLLLVYKISDRWQYVLYYEQQFSPKVTVLKETVLKEEMFSFCIQSYYRR